MGDPLAALLARPSVSGSVFCRASCRGAFGFSSDAQPDAIFHVVVEGRAHASTGRHSADLRAGDLALFVSGAPHKMRSSPREKTVRIEDQRAEHAQTLPTISMGKDGDATEILCGRLVLSPLVRAHVVPHLPAMLTQTDWQPGRAFFRAMALVLEVETSSGRVGHEVIAGRLAEIMFVHAIRAAAELGHARGWLLALADAQLSRALAAVHSAPDRQWTISALAKVAGLSRSAFFQRFNDVTGQSPGSYMSDYRLALADQRLCEDLDLSVTECAASVGFSSVAAFSRAFKRAFGQTPTERRAR